MKKIHRFIDNFDFSKSNLIIDSEIHHQLSRVLGLHPGERIILIDKNGIEAQVEIISMDATKTNVTIISKQMTKKAKQTVLYLAILKRENFELAVQKATEVGIARIVPIITERTIKLGLKIDRLKKIAQEAAEQSGRSTIPEISDPVNFKDIYQDVSDAVFFDTKADIQPLEGPATSIFIGPEGGWSDHERELAKNAGWAQASLGSLTMRAETAAIIASYLICK